MAAKNIYSDSLVNVSVIIAAEETASPFISCKQVPDETGQLAGAAQLVGVIIPENFPAEATIGFEDKQGEDDDPAAILLADGADSGYLTVPIPAPAQRNKIPLFPYWFISSGLVSLKSDVPMDEDTTVIFVFQPLIQSVA